MPYSMTLHEDINKCGRKMSCNSLSSTFYFIYKKSESYLARTIASVVVGVVDDTELSWCYAMYRLF